VGLTQLFPNLNLSLNPKQNFLRGLGLWLVPRRLPAVGGAHEQDLERLNLPRGGLLLGPSDYDYEKDYD